jgi:hypothetical protein
LKLAECGGRGAGSGQERRWLQDEADALRES